MRPVLRGPSPQATDFDRHDEDYQNAATPLKGRLGFYCSFCERRILNSLAVEHIQAKKFRLPDGTTPYAHLIGCWENFLLACVNCNSTKGNQDVDLSAVVLPDRDNTFAAFQYTADGRVSLANGAPAGAAELIRLTGIDKRIRTTTDENGKIIAEDRSSQRLEEWGVAARLRILWERRPTVELQETIQSHALRSGFFSIWMTVFDGDTVMRQGFIGAFPGTAHDCFGPVTTAPISPRPLNGLPHGGKI